MRCLLFNRIGQSGNQTIQKEILRIVSEAIARLGTTKGPRGGTSMGPTVPGGGRPILPIGEQPPILSTGEQLPIDLEIEGIGNDSLLMRSLYNQGQQGTKAPVILGYNETSFSGIFLHFFCCRN